MVGVGLAVKAAPFVIRVNISMVWPILARCGELLVVDPESPTRTVTVLTANACWVIRWRYLEDGSLCTRLRLLANDGVVSFLTSRDRRNAVGA